MPTPHLRRSVPLAVLLLAALLLGLREAPGGVPQEPPAAAAVPEAVAPTAEEPSAQVLARLSYDREFYSYDGSGRRDPFQPLLDVELAGGPRFDELVLTGVFVGEEGEGMVVVEDAARKGYFLKPGDLVGKATLVQILPEEAVFEVRDFGISRRETLKLQRPEEVT